MYVYAQYVPRTTDAQREFFFQKSETFGLGQTNWAEILWCIWGISGQTVSTILALWVPCPWENVAGSLSHKKLVLGLKHLTPECSQNKISAVKNLGSSVHTSVFGGNRVNVSTKRNFWQMSPLFPYDPPALYRALTSSTEHLETMSIMDFTLSLW